MAGRNSRFDANRSLDTVLNVKEGQECFSRASNLVQWQPSLNLARKSQSPNIIFSPLDRIRSGKQQRAFALGRKALSHQTSFEGNQSFPTISTRKKSILEDLNKSLSAAPRVKSKVYHMDKIRGDGLHSYSFAPGRTRGSFTPGPERPHSGLDSCSWSLLSSSVGGTPATSAVHTTGAVFPGGGSALNPNKAVFTVDAKTSQILMVNDTACRLLGYSADELVRITLRDLFRSSYTPQLALSEAQQLDSDGNMVLCSGKVVEMLTRDRTVVPVSLWLRRFAPTSPTAGAESEERLLAVIEPVVRREARLLLDAGGRILTADGEACLLFQHEPAEMIGLPASALIPSIQLPQMGQGLTKEVRKQKATGRTKDGISFPLSVRLKESLHPDEVDNANTSMLYSATIWVFTSMSGLIVVSEEGLIESCNHHFAKMMFGYAQPDLLGKPVSLILPNFCEDLERIDGSNVAGYEDDYEDDEDEEDGAADLLGVGELLGEAAGDVANNRSVTPDNNNGTSESKLTHSFHQLNLHSPKHRLSNGGEVVCKIPHASVFSLNPQDNLGSSAKKQQSSSCSLDCLEAPANAHSTPIRRPSCHLPQPRCMSATDITPAGASCHQHRYSEGSFIGVGKHRDGATIDIVYQVRRVQLNTGRSVLCVWVSRDPDEVVTEGGNCMTLTSSFNSTIDNSLGQAIRSCAQQQQQQNAASQTTSVMEEEYCSGEYSMHYATLQQIGKGAFGCVKMAYRKQDGMLVITKFIEKNKVYQESWVDDAMLGRKVPLEISLLTALNHPNIVQVIDVFENDLYFQMVMMKHGSGMDLFEFIDRDPDLDEPLASYIFRQIVSAVEYLHSLQILHRDLKDENVILDHNFHVKLIDFGSATFMSEGRLFSTFYGTVEYCSPEVLAGNKYAGPELEMWSLGVTLYIMAFGENPFYDVDETVKAEMHPPYDVSQELMQLLSWMLAKDPRERCRLSQVVQHPWLNIPVDPRNYRFEEVVQCSAVEAHPPMFYSELTNETNMGGGSTSLSVGGLGSDLATASPSRRHGSRPSGVSARSERTRSSHSPYSLTTIENFDDEEEDPDDMNRLTPLESDGFDQRGRSVTPEAHCQGKIEHRCEEAEQTEVEGRSWHRVTPSAPLNTLDQDTNWDTSHYYEEDSFS